MLLTVESSSRSMFGDDVLCEFWGLARVGGRGQPHCAHADCGCWPHANASHVVLLEPDDPVVPEPLLVGARSVGSCSDVSIDATTSTGGGGRAWKHVRWWLDENSTSVATNLTSLHHYLAAATDEADATGAAATLVVPFAFLLAGETYV